MERIFEPTALNDVFLNEDGHAQERSLLPSVLETVKAKQVWIADRNFCTRQFLLGIASRQSYFIIREHKSIPHKELSPLTEIGETETGRVFEQEVQISYDDANLNLRRVVIQLHQPTRHSDREVALLHTCGAFWGRIFLPKSRLANISSRGDYHSSTLSLKMEY
jgi:hypothetical protein